MQSHDERSTVRGSATLALDHYLEVLARKPGALPGATALAQARAAGTFTATHEAFWAAARTALGDAEGTRELVEALLLHRHMRSIDVVDGLAAALAVRADVVAIEARRVADLRGHGPLAPVEPELAEPELERAGRVFSLTQRRLTDPAAVIAGLPPDERPLHSVAGYDELLTRRTSADLGADAGASSSSTGEVS